MQAWLGDITNIPTAEGWLYLAGLKDLFTKEIVGYHMGSRMTKELVCNCLWRAIAGKGTPRKGLIHHCDRGSQYCSHEFRACLESYEIKESMSRKGNCYDNAPIESFWGILKTELVYQCRFATRPEAMQMISEYIEIFYNRQRKQAGLGFLSPAAFEKKFYEKRLAA
jgi:putative transposase